MLWRLGITSIAHNRRRLERDALGGRKVSRRSAQALLRRAKDQRAGSGSRERPRGGGRDAKGQAFEAISQSHDAVLCCAAWLGRDDDVDGGQGGANADDAEGVMKGGDNGREIGATV